MGQMGKSRLDHLQQDLRCEEWDSWKVERAVHAWTSLVDELN